MTARRIHSVARVAIIAAAVVCILWQFRGPRAPAPDPKVLSSFEELVLMRLDGLRGNPLAGGFLSGLKRRPDLRRYLTGTEDPRVLEDFRDLVRKYQGDAGFREAVDKAELAGIPRPAPPRIAAAPASGPQPSTAPAPAHPAPAVPAPAETAPAPCGPPGTGPQPEPAALDAAGPKCGAEPAPSPLTSP